MALGGTLSRQTPLKIKHNIERKKRMKKIIALFFALIVSLALCACGSESKIKNEEGILADIPEDFLVVNYYDGNYDGSTECLEYNSIEIDNRTTEDDVDDIFFTLNASNDLCEVSVPCHFTYRYIDSEWKLEFSEVSEEDHSIIPTAPPNYSYPESILNKDGINHFNLKDANLGENGNGDYYSTFTYEYTISWPLYEQTLSRDFAFEFSSWVDFNGSGGTVNIRWISLNDDETITDESWDIYKTWTYVNDNPFAERYYTITLSYVDDENIKYEARYVYKDGLYGKCDTISTGSGIIPLEVEYDNSWHPTMELTLPMIYEQVEPFDIHLGNGEVKHVEAGAEAPSIRIKFDEGTAKVRIDNGWMSLSN